MRTLLIFVAVLCSGACFGQTSPASDFDDPVVTIYTHFHLQPAPEV
jgi:hypothetical protein